MRTPTVLQAQVTECGVASLGSVLAYYGVDLPLEELRQRTGVSREGSSAKELLEAARGLGFDARGFRKSPKRLAECELPVIAHVGFGHFVVVERMGEDVVRTNDPICGPREEPRALFEERYTGVVLVVRPPPPDLPDE